jgi:hypothetical protein
MPEASAKETFKYSDLLQRLDGFDSMIDDLRYCFQN